MHAGAELARLLLSLAERSFDRGGGTDDASLPVRPCVRRGGPLVTSAPSVRARPAVLVVGDDPAVREAFGRILDGRYDIRVAETGTPAVDLVPDRRLELVLLDVGVPSTDGFECLARMKEVAPSVPVIVVSATAKTEAVVRAMKLGASDYVTKPFRDQDLLATIGSALGGAVSHPSRPASRRREPFPRGRCLVMVAHAGTAGTLRLVLEKYVETSVASSGARALRAMGAAAPQCVVCDEPMWDAEGAPFVRAFRGQHPETRVILIGGSASASRLPDRITPIDDVVSEHAGLAEVVRRTLALCSGAGPTAEPPPGPYVFAAMEFLRWHYAEGVTSRDIARAAGISRGHLAERFRAEVGLTVSRYLMRLRVEVAKLLLSAGSGKLAEISTRTGFRHPSHLSRVFQAHTGRRPGAYGRETRASP